MPIETDTDRAVFVNASDFGVEAVYTVAGGVASDPFAGIFDDPSIGVAVGDMGVVTNDAKPTFFCPSSSIPSGADENAGDTLMVNGRTYVVVAINPDGQGMVQVRLGASA